MNETFVQKVIVALLIILVALSGVSMYVMNAQLRSITQLLQTSSSSSLQQACVSSGGELQNGTCVCERDYVLENGMCMGQDGMTQKELNEVKIRQERLMKQAEKYCDTEAGGTGLCFDYPRTWSVTRVDDDFTSGQKNLVISANAAGGRVTIQRLNDGQKGMKGPRVPEFPGLYELGELCSDDDGLTCPQYPYYLTLDGDRTAYAIRAHYRWDDRAEVQSLVDVILRSIEVSP